jgi:hypothetical protein
MKICHIQKLKWEGGGHTDMVIHKDLFLLGRGLAKSYKQCKTDHNHNFTTECLNVEYNPNFYANLHKWKPYAVHRLFN